MSDVVFLYENRDGVVWLIMNCFDVMNFISLDMIVLYEQYMEQILIDDVIKVVVIIGMGRVFCVGVDFKQVQDSFNVFLGELDFFDCLCDNVLNLLCDFFKFVIVVFNGIIMVGGLEIVMCVDFVVVVESVQIGDVYVNFGVYLGVGGVVVLLCIVFYNVVKYLLFIGNILLVQEMKIYGFVNEVVVDENLQEVVQVLVLYIVVKSFIVLCRMKLVVNVVVDKICDDVLLYEMYEFCKYQCFWDMQEGLVVFVEKCKFEFQGC